MTTDEAKSLVGVKGAVVQDSMDTGIWGKIEYVTEDAWAGIRGPYNRLDEVPVSRLEIDPT